MKELQVTDNFYQVVCAGLNPGYKYDLRQFAMFLKKRNFGFEVEALREWKATLQEQGYRASTINYKLLVSKLAFKKFLNTHGQNISVNLKNSIITAISEIKGLKNQAPAIASKVITENELLKVLNYADTARLEIALYIEFLWRTGLRVSEMLDIRLRDIKQVSAGVYEIRVIGKGSKERLTWITGQTFSILKKYFRPTDFLFQKNGRRRSRSFVSMNIKRLCSKVLGRSNLSAHSLRHSFATHCLEKNMNLQWVSQSLGHADITITSKYYSHLSIRPEDLLNVVAFDRKVS